MQDSFNEIVNSAEKMLKQNDWENALAQFNRALKIQPNHIGVLIGTSICLLSMGKDQEAIKHLKKAADLAPDSAESWINLASAYLAANDLENAEKYYLKAAEINPQNPKSWKMLAQMYLSDDSRMQEGVRILAAVLEDFPEDTEALVLLGQCYQAGDDLESARLLYEKALAVDPQNQPAQSLLQSLEPKANIVETKSLADKLSSLKGLTPEKKPKDIKASFYSNGEVSDPMRVINPARALHDAGCVVKAGVIFKDEHIEQYDFFVFSRPQITRTQMEGMEKCRAAGKTIFIDLDDDFLSIPRSHPGYKTFGPGSKAAVERLEKALGMADVLTTPSPVIAERYAKFVPETIVIPNNWWSGNELWEKPRQRRRTINIGWAGTITHRKDFRQVIKPLEKIAKKYDSVQFIIGGDAKIMDLLSVISEDRKMFLPQVPHEDYPYMLSQFDILLAPLEDIKFNQAKSDIKLMEAGVKGIPWVASPLPAYKTWGTGGMLASSAEEWEQALSDLVENEELRKSLGEAGKEKAKSRESTVIGEQWLNILKSKLQNGRKND